MSLAPSPSRRRFDFFPPRPCFVCPRPAAANSYIRIFADGSSTGWKIGWPCCPLGCYTRGPRGKEGGGLSSFLPKIEARKKKGEKKEEIGREGGRDIGVCLLRTRPKNRALKAPRLLETLGATFSIGVWHGRMRRDNASWLPRMSIFSLFSRVFGKRSKSVLLISSFPLPFFHFSFFLFSLFFCDPSPSRKNAFHSSVFFRLIFRGYFSTIENDVKKRPQRNTRNTNRADLAGL